MHVAAAIASALCRPLRDPTSRPMMGGRLRQWLRLRRLGTLFDNEKVSKCIKSQSYLLAGLLSRGLDRTARCQHGLRHRFVLET